MKSLSTLIEPSRFAFLFKKELKENRKSLLLRGIIVVAILTAVSLLIGTVAISGYDHILKRTIYSSDGGLISEYGGSSRIWGTPEDDAAQASASFFIIAFPIVLAISASLMFESLSTKRKKIAMLMTPGTMFEKFLVRFLIYIVATTILFGLGCFIADFIRHFIFSIIYINSKVDVIHMINYIEVLDPFYWSNKDIATLSMYISMSIWGASLFALGSSVWPRLSFIKTFGAISAIGFVVIITIILCAVTCDSGGVPLIVSVAKNLFKHEYQTLNLTSVGLIIFSIINFTLAYFRLKETEIIQRM